MLPVASMVFAKQNKRDNGSIALICIRGSIQVSSNLFLLRFSQGASVRASAEESSTASKI